MAGVFLLAHNMLTVHPAWGYVHAFAEAAMVGGLADWFAVTALFRHPLGIPIPHTAIIPENKDRIADTMAEFLRSNFLTPDRGCAAHARHERGARGGRFPGQARRFDRGPIASRRGADCSPNCSNRSIPTRLGLQVKAGLARQLEKLDVSPLLGQMLEAAIADKRHRPLIDSMIRWAGLTLEDNEDMVRDMVQERANALHPLDRARRAARQFGARRALPAAGRNAGRSRPSAAQQGRSRAWKSWRTTCSTIPETRAKVERMKNDLLANPAVADWWMGVWERLRRSLIENIAQSGQGDGRRSGPFACRTGRGAATGPALQLQVNRFARRTLVGVANRYGDADRPAGFATR